MCHAAFSMACERVRHVELTQFVDLVIDEEGGKEMGNEGEEIYDNQCVP